MARGFRLRETIFATHQGSVRIIDAMTLPNDRLDPMRVLVRSVEGIAGVAHVVYGALVGLIVRV